jgi:hypothetical protein
LLYPWRPAPLRSEDYNEVAAAISGIAPCTLTFRQVGRFPGALYLVPEPEDVVRALLKRLMNAFPETPPYGGQFGSDLIPHLTIALASTEEELDHLQAEIVARLQPRIPIHASVHALSIIQEVGEAGAWREFAVIPLNGS